LSQHGWLIGVVGLVGKRDQQPEPSLRFVSHCARRAHSNISGLLRNEALA
jgi:hypothetical protein